MNSLALWLAVICGFLTILGFLGRVLVLVTRHLDGQRNLQSQLAEHTTSTARQFAELTRQSRRDRRRLRAIERELFLRPHRGRQPELETATP